MAQFNDIPLYELQQELAAGTVTLVDVREQDEWNAGHIKGAHFLPLSKFDPGKLPAPEAGKKIVIYCRSGRRSITAMEHARLGGRKDCDTHFGGGILAWINAGRDVEKG
jgi:rhodanese-related sulfurtransferase